MSYIIKTIKHNDLTINIKYDEYTESPREWCNLGTIVGYHRRYDLVDISNPVIGENGSHYADFLAYLRTKQLSISDVVYLPVYAYVHSGVCLNTTGFSCDWDSGQVGYIYVARSNIRRDFSVKRVTKKLSTEVEKTLASEVSVFSQYLEGEVYGFEVLDTNDNIVDSCYGFYSVEDAMSHATENLTIAA